ncbi:hypothetical protein FG379_001468 [Cryptosporidium bovis]|uniref:uncharacterized protein n=1 Tax=Cryptosporidium bovis TaxID=310047 RepID=UPI00351A1BE0|nr:hypothetical protein FG379_001468 [Cryptosporidium bovis]
MVVINNYSLSPLFYRKSIIILLLTLTNSLVTIVVSNGVPLATSLYKDDILYRTADLDSYSAISVNQGSSTQLLGLVASEAIPAHGEKRFLDISEGLATKQVIERINSYTPQNIEVAERYAANMVAIAKLREEIYLDAKSYYESVKMQFDNIPESEKLKENLRASKQKLDLAEHNYIISKKASERALEIYVKFVRPKGEDVLLRAEATEGKGLEIAHSELANMEQISLPDMDNSVYEPLDADASLMSIGESVVPTEETKEAKIIKALDKLSATIEEDFISNNEEIVGKSETIEASENNEELLDSLLEETKADDSEDGKKDIIPYSISASFPSISDSLTKQRKITIIQGVNLGDVPEYLHFMYRRSYLQLYVMSTFVESFVLPQFFTDNPAIKLGSVFRISKTFISHVLFGLASKYRLMFTELKRLPYNNEKNKNLMVELGKIEFSISTANMVLQNSLNDSEECYKTVAELISDLPFNVREVISKFSESIKGDYQNSDYSFLTEKSIYSGPKTIFPELSKDDEAKLLSIDEGMKNSLGEYDVKELTNDLKESQLWIRDYVLRNAAYKYHQFKKNNNVNPYFDFKQFGLELTPEVEKIYNKLKQ